MANPNKAKGSRWESALVDFFRAHGFPEVSRIRGRGVKDEGDLGGLRSFALEAKDHAAPDHYGFIRQANQEAKNAGKPFAVVIQKKRRGKTEDAMVSMDLVTFVALLRYIEALGGKP